MCQQTTINLLAAHTHTRTYVRFRNRGSARLSSTPHVSAESVQKATRIQSEQMGKPSLREPIQEQFEHLNKSQLLHNYRELTSLSMVLSGFR